MNFRKKWKLNLYILLIVTSILNIVVVCHAQDYIDQDKDRWRTFHVDVEPDQNVANPTSK